MSPNASPSLGSVRAPLLFSVPVASLRPTQITVGYREVKLKRKRWRELGEDSRSKFLSRHMMPVVLGPKERHYILDHHHLARALLDEGQTAVYVTVVSDLHRLDKDEFLSYLDNRGWLHLFGDNGEREPIERLPKSVGEMKDDPYRSLAGELRRIGGFAKDATPFSEFLWADYLRRRVKRKLVDEDFSAAMELALKLAKDQKSDHLPGWCGPTGDS